MWLSLTFGGRTLPVAITDLKGRALHYHARLGLTVHPNSVVGCGMDEGSWRHSRTNGRTVLVSVRLRFTGQEGWVAGP